MPSSLPPWHRSLRMIKVPKGRRSAPDPPAKWSIVTGDMVQVVQGHEKGERGVVRSVIRKTGFVVVDKVQLRRRWAPKTPDSPGGLFKMETPVHVSNVALIDPSTKSPTKVRFEVDASGNRVRKAHKSGTVIPYPPWERRDWKTRADYIEAPGDTTGGAAAQVTFKPALMSFEESVLRSLGLLKISPPKSASQ